MTVLKDIQFYFLDMDGTFYLGESLIEGAADFLDTLRIQGKKFVFLTNNSSKDRSRYKEKLAHLGCNVEENDIFTSGEATILYLKELKENAAVFLLGTPSLEEEFEKSGFHLIRDRNKAPDFVVLGFDTTLTYEKIWIACDFIRQGVKFIATHPDFNCPLENNMYMPDTGSMIKMFEASTGKSPLIIGKPYNHIIRAAAQKYGFSSKNAAIVGDRLYTDIKTGENANITSILVLSGETSREMYEQSDIRADYTFQSIKELNEAVRQVHSR